MAYLSFHSDTVAQIPQAGWCNTHTKAACMADKRMLRLFACHLSDVPFSHIYICIHTTYIHTNCGPPMWPLTACPQHLRSIAWLMECDTKLINVHLDNCVYDKYMNTYYIYFGSTNVTLRFYKTWR